MYFGSKKNKEIVKKILTPKDKKIKQQWKETKLDKMPPMIIDLEERLNKNEALPLTPFLKDK